LKKKNSKKYTYFAFLATGFFDLGVDLVLPPSEDIFLFALELKIPRQFFIIKIL